MEVFICWKVICSSLWQCSLWGQEEGGLNRYSWEAGRFSSSHPVCVETYKERRQLLPFFCSFNNRFAIFLISERICDLHASALTVPSLVVAFPLWSYSRKKSISKSQPCSYWHSILLSSLSTSPHSCQRETDISWWVTQGLGAQMCMLEEKPTRFCQLRGHSGAKDQA